MSRIVWLFLSAVLFASATQAKPLTPEQVPEPLKPWIAWVLHDSPEPIPALSSTTAMSKNAVAGLRKPSWI